MNVWIRKGGRRKGWVKEGYEGEEAYGREDYFSGFSWICWFRV
jgi:hypothetical protein